MVIIEFSQDKEIADLKELVNILRWSRNIFIVVGAGISVSSGIPDFRSSDGLYNSIIKKYPVFKNGKDLFDGGYLNSNRNIPGIKEAYFSFMGLLRELTVRATPSKTHLFIKWLVENQKVRRIYTQNIDGLEKRTISVNECTNKVGGDIIEKPKMISEIKFEMTNKTSNGNGGLKTLKDFYKTTKFSGNAQKELVKIEDKIVALHGNLDFLICTVCNFKIEFNEVYVEIYRKGKILKCNECLNRNKKRIEQGKRKITTGLLTPEIFLYNDHSVSGFTSGKQLFELAEENGEYISKDIKYLKTERLFTETVIVVMGTSCKVTGIKKLIKSLSKSVKQNINTKSNRIHKVVYINKDPLLQIEWKQVMDIQIIGDCDKITSYIWKSLLETEE